MTPEQLTIAVHDLRLEVRFLWRAVHRLTTVVRELDPGADFSEIIALIEEQCPKAEPRPARRPPQ